MVKYEKKDHLNDKIYKNDDSYILSIY